MSTTATVAGNKSWTGELRRAIDAGNEPLYRQQVMQFLGTREGFVFVDELMKRPASLAVMRRSFKALAAPLGLSHPNELVSWLRSDVTAPRPTAAGAKDVVSMALPYFRFARGWARAVHKDGTYAVALAMLFFEPVLGLCERPATPPQQSVDDNSAAPPSFARITQRA
jgi:hypothetical protein